jgi:hypothetical protein
LSSIRFGRREGRRLMLQCEPGVAPKNDRLICRRANQMRRCTQAAI